MDRREFMKGAALGVGAGVLGSMGLYSYSPLRRASSICRRSFARVDPVSSAALCRYVLRLLIRRPLPLLMGMRAGGAV